MSRRAGFLMLVGFVATIPLANWSISHIGTQEFPGGPHVIPVGFGWSAPSGVLWIGAALVLRDGVHRSLGRSWALLGIGAGVVVSFVVASSSIAVASAVAFGLGELADMGVYQPLQERRLYLAVVLSGVVGALVDSLVFLQLAFSSTRYWEGNTLGKIWMSIAALPAVALMRRRELARA